MDSERAECLRCGQSRAIAWTRAGRLDPAECDRCGYVGWAPASELSETTRRLLRERPPSHEARLRAV